MNLSRCTDGEANVQCIQGREASHKHGNPSSEAAILLVIPRNDDSEPLTDGLTLLAPAGRPAELRLLLLTHNENEALSHSESAMELSKSQSVL